MEIGYDVHVSIRDTFFSLPFDAFQKTVSEMSMEDAEMLWREYERENQMVEMCVKVVGWPWNEDLMALVG